ncbi:ATP synthase F1 subcomplex delta subunit [Nakamurella panacisegetis]|uniref:ATP synthase subunit delta n=1 Tax=Nakamurella panacisegetis TaxID=1090615 RepID=A0A1H0SNS7_9ACTN|nr:F0F1 ATP synthase subunit delta [Nakamurella panacisegetis]SDP43370.1 ATP synthase F1 subcomplex delta subunit [Nakamurella panacisegetis]
MEHIASTQALAASNGQLLLQAATLDDTGLGALGSDLSGVGSLLGGNAALRRTLSEATTDVEHRAGLMRSLLAGKVGDPAAALVDFAVRKSWATGRDLAEGFVRLGRTAMFLRAERAGELDEVEDQLFRFGRIVDASPELSVILDDPTTPGASRAALVGRLLSGRVHRLTADLLEQLARDPGGRAFTHGVRQIVEQAAERKDRVVASVQAATPLTIEQTSRLTAALGRIYGRSVSVHVEVEPQLAGGLKVRIGDEVIDGSVSGRLDALRRRLTG